MTIPSEIKNILAKLEAAGFEAYAVGGCVRDLLLKKKPKDWDVATSALPEQIQEIFSDSFYENKFGTVGVKTGSDDEALAVVEVTTFRADEKYSDKRHPDAVRFTKNLEEDLARRDFTINAIALNTKGKIIDPFDGQKDLKAGLIRAVGEPEKGLTRTLCGCCGQSGSRWNLVSRLKKKPPKPSKRTRPGFRRLPKKELMMSW